MREISSLISAPSNNSGELIYAEDLTTDFVPILPTPTVPALPEKSLFPSLPPVQHSSISYTPVLKANYNEHPSVSNLSSPQLSDYFKKHNITASGLNMCKPILDFHHLPLDMAIIDKIFEQNIFTPTPIQSLALPAGFAGRDLLAISQTASGKTLAFVLPLVYSVRNQGKSCKGEGPIGLILVPTRELCMQVFKEVKKYAAVLKLKVVALYGGVPKTSQWKDLKAGCEIVVATPARLIDLVQSKACALKKVSFLVIDEADLMFNMGFEYQVRSILSQIRPDRQTLLFSATLRRKLENFIQEFINDPLKISIGSELHCNPAVTQKIIVLDHPAKKLTFLLEHIQEYLRKGLVLIFVKHQSSTEELSQTLKEANIPAASLHGDMDQNSREIVVDLYKRSQIRVLVATDVASRGINIIEIATVVNYDCAKDVETHIHRIGRTGREGQGESITLLTKFDKKFAGDLLLNIEYNDQVIPDRLEELAMEDQLFRVQRMKNDREKVRHCKTGDIGTARSLIDKLGKRKIDLDKDMTSEEFRQHIQGKQRDCFQEEFKQKFVSAGNLVNEVKETTVTYLDKPRKKSKWDIQ